MPNAVGLVKNTTFGIPPIPEWQSFPLIQSNGLIKPRNMEVVVGCGH